MNIRMLVTPVRGCRGRGGGGLSVLASHFLPVGHLHVSIFLQYALASTVCSGISVFWCKFLKFNSFFNRFCPSVVECSICRVGGAFIRFFTSKSHIFTFSHLLCQGTYRLRRGGGGQRC